VGNIVPHHRLFAGYLTYFGHHKPQKLVSVKRKYGENWR
jgi:hypothetical protein